jgi:hypothetical protein
MILLQNNLSSFNRPKPSRTKGNCHNKKQKELLIKVSLERDGD